MALFSRFFADENTKALKEYDKRVSEINSLEEIYSGFSDDELEKKTQEFRTGLADGKNLDDVLPHAFAVVRESAKRTLGQRHYDVQLVGGMIMHDGKIAEMRTGEGKTLVATLPTYLNALTGKGVHVVTVNDYLARRDAVWMGEIYAFLGLSVGVINNQQSFLYDKNFAPQGSPEDEERDESGFYKVVHEYLKPCTRTEAYAADITYGTNNEFGFDYLRDNISYKEEDLRQRGFHFAIIDEIDSILIDEARTPLIISAPTHSSENLYATFADIARTFIVDTDYVVDEKQRAVELTDAGIEKAEKALGVENIYTDKGIKYVHHLETAVRAEALFKREKEYVVQDDKVMIVDEFTGRILAGRRYSEGLHQAIEAKEGVTLQKEARTFASVTYQNYFRMYEKLSGMTGTAVSSKEEFYKVYSLDVLSVPTNKAIARVDHDDLIFQTEIGKFKAIARAVKEKNEKGQPVLIGTVSIEKNELLSQFLNTEGVKHTILNAKNHEQEGLVTARAGARSAVTIATNMAGRGVDIKLGGDGATEEEAQKIKDLGGLFVIGTERHDARRVDNQLRGRAGRQGDPGETQFFVSLEDDLMRIFASDPIKKMMGRFNIPEDQAIENKMITRALESAQEKIEGFNFDARKHVLQFDDVLNQQRSALYKDRNAILHAKPKDLINIIGAYDESGELVLYLEQQYTEMGEEDFARTLKQIALQSIDMFWVEHLEIMDYTRSSVNLRAYGQHDPIVEYRKEGLRMFRETQAAITEQIVRIANELGKTAHFKEERQKLQEIHASAKKAEESSHAGGTQGTVVNTHKYGRNDKVEIQKGDDVQIVKYKKAEIMADDGWKIIKRAE